MKKKIAVFNTGGTIAMKKDESGVVDIQETNSFSTVEPELFDNIEFIYENVLNLPSPHITEQEMLILRNAIVKKITSEPIAGIIVTHGTDILEETAYFLDLTVQHEIPIVLTGAMRSSNEIGADGLHNFILAARVATSEVARNKGVLVVLNDDIHAARNVTKTHTSNVATFQSPLFGPVGIITKKNVFIHQSPLRPEYYNINRISKNVMLLKAYAGMNADIFEALINTNIHGLVVEAFGQGNLPPKVIPGLQKFIDKKIPVVITSRCFNGIAEGVYGYAGGGKHLEALGVIFSNGLNGPKARLKLMIALEVTTDYDEIKKMLELC